jgi:glycosyltransferase involved in cell wall biosynthesis
MIAYHFPPLGGSSGIQRTLRFVQQLPACGWNPVVLSITPGAYEQVREDLVAEIPPDIPVTRAFGLDTARHLAFKGRYWGRLALPDRWASWWIAAVLAGWWLIRQHRPVAIWSTYPIATAHRVGATLQRLSGLPWIADFRDPMAQDGYPSDPRRWRSYKLTEEIAVERATKVIFTTPGALRTYGERYPVQARKMSVVENGYDEGSFDGISAGGALNPGKTTLLHSGIVYPNERDPTALMEALKLLADRTPELRATLRIRFRAPVAVDLLRGLIERYGITDMVEVLPAINYRAALAEMLSSEGLLILQSAGCNDQIPAKVYEYLRAGRPIIGLTDATGDTAAVLRDAGIEAIAPLDNAALIAEAISKFVADIRNHTALCPAPRAIAAADRRNRTREFAALLDRVRAQA